MNLSEAALLNITGVGGGDIPSPHSLRNRLARVLWFMLYIAVFRLSPRPLHAWRCLVLRAMGARIGRGAHVYPSAVVWAPWNLVMEDHSCLGPHVECYNVAPVIIGRHATVSQYAFLCTATHDYSLLTLPLVTKPIQIRDHAWVCADVFIGPGVTVGEGAVAGARSSVYRAVEPWTVVAGNPARFLKRRELRER